LDLRHRNKFKKKEFKRRQNLRLNLKARYGRGGRAMNQLWPGLKRGWAVKS